jgi:hypothetical protein
VKTAANVAFDLPEVVELDAKAPADMIVRWTAEGDNEEVFLDLGIGDKSVTCWFDSKARIGSVPAAMISELTSEGDTCEPPSCMMFLASKRSQSVAVGAWTMVLAHGFATVKNVRIAR